MTTERDRDEALYERLKTEAETAGYLLNPDIDFVMDLMTGLVTNDERYGYLACPCRDADGERTADLDIICPCDYRDPDLAEYGTCYCALYVSETVASGAQKLGSIPERRPLEDERREQGASESRPARGLGSSEPIWKCSVCGYLCARPEPPLKCPVCKVDKDRFATFATAEPIWKCSVCGYLCARPEPPLKCPVCKADSDRFESFS